MSRDTLRERLLKILHYKVVETRRVADQSLEEILNTWTARGRQFEGIRFALREADRWLATASITFTREEGETQSE